MALDVRAGGVPVPDAAGLEPGWPSALAGLAMLMPGVLLLRMLPRHAVAWVLTGFGLLWLVDGLATSWAIYAVYAAPGTPGASAAYWFYARFGATLLLGLPMLILLFPDGRLPTGRVWRALSVTSLTLTGLLSALLVTAPVTVMTRFHDMPLPPEIARLDLDALSVALPYGFWEPALRVAYLSILVSMVIPFAVTVHRHRAADPERRAQIRWLMWAALVDMAVLLLPLRTPPEVPAALFVLIVGLTSAAVVVAVAKYRLYDIDRLLSATVAYGVLAALVVLVDVAVFTVAGSVLGERDSALAAIAIVAVVYAPLRGWLWRGRGGSCAGRGTIPTRRSPRWPSGWSWRPIRTSSWSRSRRRWPRRSGSATCGWRSNARTGTARWWSTARPAGPRCRCRWRTGARPWGGWCCAVPN
nr:hypothetical protein GCM10020093_007860 [Planobispora longispora]